MKKRVIILGSTGSIGTQVLQVIRKVPERLSVVGLSALKNEALLTQQRNEFSVHRKHAVLGAETELEQLCRTVDADIVVVSVAGSVGIKATLAALETGKDVALATKEVLVAAGSVVMDTAKRCGQTIYPIDSEHSAIFQCLQGNSVSDISRIQITGSGGPFRTLSAKELEKVTLEQALIHPTWPNMGRKITIDSATLMNKGLEAIEAKWLFDVPPGLIEVLIHPQSIVHSMVQFIDGSVMAQCGPADMRLAIAYALLYPERVNVEVPPLDITSHTLTFEKPDLVRFPCLKLALDAMQSGGTVPAVLNAANEQAVSLFLDGTISFQQLPNIIDSVVKKHTPLLEPSLNQILQSDLWAREEVRASVSQMTEKPL